MSEGITWQNRDAFLRAVTGITDRADQETRRAVAEGLAAIQRQAQINSQGRPGPNVVTGAHRRGIKVTPVERVGAHQWGGSVGPTMIYSRALELGGARNWPQGLRFPYFVPAVQMAARIAIPVLFRRAWERATQAAAA